MDLNGYNDILWVVAVLCCISWKIYYFVGCWFFRLVFFLNREWIKSYLIINSISEFHLKRFLQAKKLARRRKNTKWVVRKTVPLKKCFQDFICVLKELWILISNELWKQKHNWHSITKEMEFQIIKHKNILSLVEILYLSSMDCCIIILLKHAKNRHQNGIA